MMEEIRPGRYRHFKGQEYELLFLARHSETEEEMAVYRALYGEGGIWVRPASMWNDVVERDGKAVRRFTFIGDPTPHENRKRKKDSRKVLRAIPPPHADPRVRTPTGPGGSLFTGRCHCQFGGSRPYSLSIMLYIAYSRGGRIEEDPAPAADRSEQAPLSQRKAGLEFFARSAMIEIWNEQKERRLNS